MNTVNITEIFYFQIIFDDIFRPINFYYFTGIFTENDFFSAKRRHIVKCIAHFLLLNFARNLINDRTNMFNSCEISVSM